jgi:hypothetical protein
MNYFDMIYDWQVNRSDNFSCQLLNLFCKADSSNMAKLDKAFPKECSAWHWWQSGEFEKALRASQEAAQKQGN